MNPPPPVAAASLAGARARRAPKQTKPKNTRRQSTRLSWRTAPPKIQWTGDAGAAAAQGEGYSIARQNKMNHSLMESHHCPPSAPSTSRGTGQTRGLDNTRNEPRRTERKVTPADAPTARRAAPKLARERERKLLSLSPRSWPAPPQHDRGDRPPDGKDVAAPRYNRSETLNW